MIEFGDIVEVIKNDRECSVSVGTIGIITDIRIWMPDGCPVYKVETIEAYGEFTEGDLRLIRKYNPMPEKEDELSYSNGLEDGWKLAKEIYNMDISYYKEIFKESNIGWLKVIDKSVHEVKRKYKKWIDENTIVPGNIAVLDNIQFFVTYVDDHKIQGFSLCGGGMMSAPKNRVKKVNGINCSEAFAELMKVAREE